MKIAYTDMDGKDISSLLDMTKTTSALDVQGTTGADDDKIEITLKAADREGDADIAILGTTNPVAADTITFVNSYYSTTGERYAANDDGYVTVKLDLTGLVTEYTVTGFAATALGTAPWNINDGAAVPNAEDDTIAVTPKVGTVAAGGKVTFTVTYAQVGVSSLYPAYHVVIDDLGH